MTKCDVSKPVDPAGGMENAGNRPESTRLPGSGVSHTSLDGALRRPQAPQALPRPTLPIWGRKV